ncbi:MAG: adenosylmethionine--8-amino-7-oxononanoate transaminase [Nitrospiria bacterium]
MPSDQDKRKLIQHDHAFIWHPFTQMQEWLNESPLIIERGEGVFLWDIDGNRYFDGYSSVWVNLHGHQKEEINRAIETQLNKIAHSTFLGLSNIPAIQLAEKLVHLTPEGLSRLFYSDNGSTAVEIALKMAFQYWRHKGEPSKKKMKFVALYNGYHGDTIGTMSVGGIPLFQDIFKSLYFSSYKVESPYCYRCPLKLKFPDCQIACLNPMEEILKNHHEEIAAIVMEPGLQAAGGMIVLPPGYLSRVSALSKKYGVLLILDEVATGFGRTGKMFACNHENVSPDLMAIAKGLTGGYLPLAATLSTEEIFESFLGPYEEFKTFFHGHSYTGNQLGCAAAIANLEIFQKENTLQNLQEKILHLKKILEPLIDFHGVGDVRQIGLIGIIELVKNKKTKESFDLKEKKGMKICQEARKRGLLIRPLGNILVLIPPLSTTIVQLSEMTDILRESIAAVMAATRP